MPVALTARMAVVPQRALASALAVAMAASLLAFAAAGSPTHDWAAGSVVGARPLARALRGDGRLGVTQGSFDARGYRMVLSRSGAPRFVRATAAAAAGLGALRAGSALAATGDDLWSDRFGIVGIPQPVSIMAVAVSGSNIYVGGRFSSLGGDGGIAANDVAMWNGHGWFPLGSGIGPSTQTVFALAVLGGKLFAGGDFTTAGGTPVNRLASWGGASWSDVDGGVSSPSGQPRVNALAVSGSTLYVGGSFNQVGPTTVAHSVAAWDTTHLSWRALGDGIQNCGFSGGKCSTPGTGTVNALAVSGSTLYAGGVFTDVDGHEIDDLAAWNGTAWSAVGGNAIRS